MGGFYGVAASGMVTPAEAPRRLAIPTHNPLIYEDYPVSIGAPPKARSDQDPNKTILNFIFRRARLRPDLAPVGAPP